MRWFLLIGGEQCVSGGAPSMMTMVCPGERRVRHRESFSAAHHVWLTLSFAHVREKLAALTLLLRSVACRRWRLLAVYLTGILLIHPCSGDPLRLLRAESGTVATRTGHGLRLVVDARWVDGNGMRPIRVQLQDMAPGVSPNQRQFRVQLTIREQREIVPYRPPQRSTLRVSDTVELPAGSAVGEKIIAVPQYAPWESIEVRVWLGRQELRQLSVILPDVRNAPSVVVAERLPNILFVDHDARQGIGPATASVLPANETSGNKYFNVATLLQVIPYEVYEQNAGIWRSTTVRSSIVAASPSQTQPGVATVGFTSAPHPGDSQVATTIATHETMFMVHPASLPERWIDLSAVDMIFTSLSEVRTLTRFPSKLRALRDWVCAGHVLVVGGMGDDSSRFGELSKLLNLPALSVSEDADADWQTPPKPDRISFPFQGFPQIPPRPFGPMPTPTFQGGTVSGERMTVGMSTSDVTPRFRMKKIGTGVVVGFAADDPCESAIQLNLLFGSLPPTCLTWLNRYGISPERYGFSDDIMIPGLGTPPVYTFLVIVTLFAVAVGPLNYGILWRKKATSWVLITVPVGAALVTLGTIAYAFLYEGLGVRARIRSVTLVEPDGTMVTRARQLYYAGMAPSAGLEFPESALVVPFHSGVEESSPVTKELVWANGQAWRAGYLTSRQPRPVFVEDVGRYGSQIVIRRHPELIAINQLGAHVKKLFVQGDSNQWFEAEDIAPGAHKTLAATDRSKVERELAALGQYTYIANPVTVSRAPRGRAWMSASVAWPDTGASVHESLRLVTLERLPPRAFVAIVERPSWLPMAVSSAEEIQSVHLISGSWRESGAAGP